MKVAYMYVYLMANSKKEENVVCLYARLRNQGSCIQFLECTISSLVLIFGKPHYSNMPLSTHQYKFYLAAARVPEDQWTIVSATNMDVSAALWVQAQAQTIRQ